jgi:hypothetical protein
VLAHRLAAPNSSGLSSWISFSVREAIASCSLPGESAAPARGTFHRRRARRRRLSVCSLVVRF